MLLLNNINNLLQIIKVDTLTGETRTWFDHDCYPSEPVFVSEPNCKVCFTFVKYIYKQINLYDSPV